MVSKKGVPGRRKREGLFRRDWDFVECKVEVYKYEFETCT